LFDQGGIHRKGDKVQQNGRKNKNDIGSGVLLKFSIDVLMNMFQHSN